MRHAAVAPLAFQLEAREYEHFTLDAATADTLGWFVIALCAGIILAALYSFYIHRVPGEVVRTLLRAEALSQESAQTATELGLAKKPLALRELTRGATLARLITRVDAEEGGEARYFIPEELKYRAEVRFNKKGNGLLGLLFTCALAVVLAALLFALLPWFLGVIDKMM
jgi:hypothetical protein